MKRDVSDGGASPYEARRGADSGRVASDASRAGKGRNSPTHRIRTGSCLWCGRRIKRRPGTRGPLPRSCPTCAGRVLLRRRLRAYLRTGRHYALRLRRRDLAAAIGRIIRTLDGERSK